jgi:16S rRNA (guanine527-N7)-methyltransferase
MNLTARIDALATSLESPLPVATRKRLVAFTQLVQTWNAHLDLTAAREDAALVEVLFADAMVMADRAFVPEAAQVLDVGSGGGAPALPFALLREDVRLTMVEPLRKRIAFLRTAIGALRLADRVRAVEGRVEPGRPHAETGDVASARATFAPDLWQSAGLVLAPACLVFSVAEVEAAPGARVAHVRHYALPWSLAPRVLTRFERG